tara:strand:- start:847 stop:1074 length:228 start_codon:yes stop_codon:yes gene_type:complete
MEDKHQKEIEKLKKRIKTLNAKLKKSLETGSRFFKAYSVAKHENELLKKMLSESYREEPRSLRETLQRHFLHDGD